MAKKTNPSQKLSYENALDELEDILSKMGDGSQKLEDLLQHFERGKELLAYCQKMLEEAELKVRTLEEQSEEQ